jgi:hypothetical protein
MNKLKELQQAFKKEEKLSNLATYAGSSDTLLTISNCTNAVIGWSEPKMNSITVGDDDTNMNVNPDEKEITFKAGTTSVTINEDGLWCNGKLLILEDFND